MDSGHAEPDFTMSGRDGSGLVVPQACRFPAVPEECGESGGALRAALPAGVPAARLVPMPVDSENPYAPPAALADPDGLPGCWTIQGDYLVVRENAILPPVDLDGRGAGGPLTPLVLKLPVPMGGRVLVVLVVTGVVSFGAFHFLPEGGSGYFGLLAAAVAAALLFPLFQRGLKVRETAAFLWGEASVPALRARSRRARWRGYVAGASTVLLLGFLGLAFAARRQMAESLDLGVLDAFGSAITAAGLAIAGYLAVAVWGSLDTGWRCTKSRDGWLWIKGIGPAGLAELGRRSQAEMPPTVPRKVFKFRLQRLTLGEWRETNGLRLSAWWQTLLMLSRKPEEQEHLSYHWSERKWLEPADGDVELVAAWQRDTAETPLAGWPMIYAERGDSPTRCVRSEEIVFLSPDGRHAAMSMVARVATGKGLLEDRRETGFRSWTEDGRILATGNQRISGPLPEELEFEVRLGSTWELAQHHLQRVAAERLEVVDAAGLRRKEEEEMQRRHEVLEDAGIYGPVEVMELPGDWEERFTPRSPGC